MADITSIKNGESMLERVGKEARSAHLNRNEWRKDYRYTKELVGSEYLIQEEFLVK